MKIANRLSYEFKRVLRPLYRRLRGKPRAVGSGYECDIPVSKAKAVLRRNGLGFDQDGNPSWWYSAFDGRNSYDELTRFELDYIVSSVPKDGEILVTGCGVGLTSIFLKQRGFSEVEGFDYLPAVVASAQDIAELRDLDIFYWEADGFQPNLSKSYDCITALHWVYSAWMGNYDNPAETRTDRDLILEEFLGQYASNLKPGGVILVEFVDALLDHANPTFSAYPVRFTVDQVKRIAERVGLSVDRVVSNPTGRRPIVVLYILRAPQ